MKFLTQVLLLQSITQILSFKISRNYFTITKLHAKNKQLEDDIGFQTAAFKSGFVTILGNPNVGKSTLMNAFLKEKLSIVSPKPQTTRHRILGVVTEKDYQLVFSDTPGMLAPAYKLQEAMMESVKSAANDADVVLLLTDVYGEPLADNTILQRLQLTDRPIIIVINKMDLLADDTTKYPTRFQYEGRNTTPLPSKKLSLKDRLIHKKNKNQGTKSKHNNPNELDTSNANRNTVISPNNNNNNNNEKKIEAVDEQIEFDENGLAIPKPNTYGNTENPMLNDIQMLRKNRIELSSAPKSYDELIEMWSKLLPKADIMPVSAQNRTGVDELINKLLVHIPEGPKYFPEDQITNRDERFFTTEIIRESILGLYKDEVPYSCEVVIQSFQDKSPKLSVIEANIIVNRKSHKAIIIGKGGSMLKELGTIARTKLEAFLDRKVFLQLNVKLDEEWRSNDDSLRKYGYIESDFG